MSWLGDQFENHYLFRRIAVVFMMWFAYDLTDRSIELAVILAGIGFTATAIGVVLTAVQVIPLALMGAIFKIYKDSRS
jgi:hypothetical protein